MWFSSFFPLILIRFVIFFLISRSFIFEIIFMNLFKDYKVKFLHFWRELHFHLLKREEIIFPLLRRNEDLVPQSIVFSFGSENAPFRFKTFKIFFIRFKLYEWKAVFENFYNNLKIFDFTIKSHTFLITIIICLCFRYMFLACSLSAGTIIFLMFLVTVTPLYTKHCFKGTYTEIK